MVIKFCKMKKANTDDMELYVMHEFNECSTKSKPKNNKCNASSSAVPEPPISKTTLLEIDKDMSVASQAILQYVSGILWSWDAGSGLVIWRWSNK